MKKLKQNLYEAKHGGIHNERTLTEKERNYLDELWRQIEMEE